LGVSIIDPGCGRQHTPNDDTDSDNRNDDDDDESSCGFISGYVNVRDTIVP
jgi:hypothetical protein